jgi:phospholipid/cholesterol/gamma-HCH transport system substrate-binding protein
VGNKLVRYQIVAFVIVTVLGVTYAMFQYVGLSQTLGFGQYHVSVDMPAAGGLYANAIVTERGVTVGKVDGLRVGKNGVGVVADISLDDGVKIPDGGLKAAVTNTSAVGEQYLDFTPAVSAGPYLQPGAVVPSSSVSLPPTPDTLLANLNTLLQSVPKQDLNITINELYNAFNGSGPQMRQLLTSATQLLTAAQQNIGPTKSLISQAEPVLATQANNSANIKAFSQNLRAFTDQLRASNSDLTGTLNQAPGAINAANSLISQIQPTVPLLLANLTSVGQVTDAYLPNLRQTLVVLPAAVNDLTSSIMNAPTPGTDNVNFKLQSQNPCTTGYSTKMREPSDTAPTALPASAPYCTASKSAQTDARGAREDPCPNNPSIRSASAAGCGLYFGGTTAAKQGGTGGTSSYDASTGLFVGPNGLLYSLGAGSISGQGPTSLPGLLQQTLGS